MTVFNNFCLIGKKPLAQNYDCLKQLTGDFEHKSYSMKIFVYMKLHFAVL